MLTPQVVNLCYLIAAILFILDLKWMAHPRTAVRGNKVGAVAMAIAIFATLASNEHTLGWGWIVGGVAIGALIFSFVYWAFGFALEDQTVKACPAQAGGRPTTVMAVGNRTGQRGLGDDRHPAAHVGRRASQRAVHEAKDVFW